MMERDGVVRAACKEVQTAGINMPVNSITLIHTTCDFSELSLSTQSQWGSIQSCNY